MDLDIGGGLSVIPIAWVKIEHSAPEPTAEQIVIHSPGGIRIVDGGPITIERLRNEFIEEGKVHTKVTVLHNYLRPSEHGDPRVTFEFGPDSDLPRRSSPP